MKIKLIIGVIAIIVAVVTGWNVSKSSQKVQISELALANIEALASWEGGDADFHECFVVFHSTSTTEPQYECTNVDSYSRCKIVYQVPTYISKTNFCAIFN